MGAAIVLTQVNLCFCCMEVKADREAPINICTVATVVHSVRVSVFVLHLYFPFFVVAQLPLSIRY